MHAGGASILFLRVFGVFGVGAVIVAFVLLLIQRLRDAGQLAGSGGVQARGGGGRSAGRWHGRGTKAERRALLEKKRREVLDEARLARALGGDGAHGDRRGSGGRGRGAQTWQRRSSNRSLGKKSARWWLPQSRRRRHKEYQDERHLLQMDMEVVHRDSAIVDMDAITVSGAADDGVGSGRRAAALAVPESVDASPEATKAAVLAATFCRSCRVLKWHNWPAPASFDLRGGKFSYLVSPVIGGRRRPGDYQPTGSALGLGAPTFATAELSTSSQQSGELQTTNGDDPRLVLSLLSLPNERTVACIAHDSAPFRALSAVATSIRHPYIARLLGMHAVSPTGPGHVDPTVAVVRPLSDMGSLRDFIYHKPSRIDIRNGDQPNKGDIRRAPKGRRSSEDALNLAAYPIGQPLPIRKLQIWGRQVLEGMLALQRMGLRPVHVHAGNVMIASNDDLRVREREQFSRWRRRSQRRGKPRGRTSQENRAGDDSCTDDIEFDESQSLYRNWDSHRVVLCGFENTLLGLPMSTPQLRRRVKKAHADGFSEVETIIFGHLFFEMAFGVALDGVIPDYTGLDAERRYYDHPVRHVLDLIFEGGRFTHPKRQRSDTEDGFGDFLQEREVPVWRPRRSSHRLTVRQLCEHPFFNDFDPDCIAKVDAIPREALLSQQRQSDAGDHAERDSRSGGASVSSGPEHNSDNDKKNRMNFDGTNVEDMAKVVRVVEVFTERRWRRYIPKNRREGSGTDTPMLNAKTVTKWAGQTLSPTPTTKPRRTKQRHRRSLSRLESLSVAETDFEEHSPIDEKKLTTEVTDEMPEAGVESRHLGSDRAREGEASVPKESAHFDPKCDDDFSVGLKAGGKVDANTSTATKKADAVPQKAANLSRQRSSDDNTGRNALLAAIQAGKSLRKVEKVHVKKNKPLQSTGSAGNNMMEQILAQRQLIRG